MEKLKYEKLKVTAEDKSIRLNSILIGFYISIGLLTKIFTSLVYIENNIVLIAGIIISIGLINNKLVIKKDLLIFCYVILILFGISLFRLNGNEYTFRYLSGFILYSIGGMYLVSFKYSLKSIVNTIYVIFVLFTFFLMPNYISQIRNGYLSIDWTMDLSYNVLIGFIAVIIKNFIYPSRSKVIKLLNYLLLIYYLYYLVFINANRGSLLALVTFFILIYVCNIKSVFLRRMVLVLCVFLATIISTKFEFLLTQIDLFLTRKLNISIPLFGKMIYQYNHSSFSSGRDLIWSNSFDLFSNNILFGGGIGSLEAIYGYYAHNYILQLLSELGIIFGMPIILLSFYGFYKLYTINTEKESMIFIVILFCIAIPRLFLSETLWNSSAFWMYIFLTYRILLKNMKKKIIAK